MLAAIVKALPFLAKVASLGKWFSPLAALIPGGQIGLILTSILNGIVTLFKWLVEDVVDVFTKPRLALLAIVGICAGAWFSADWYRETISDLKSDVEKVSKQRDEAKSEIKSWEGRLNDQAQRAAEAAKARDEAEAQVKADAEAIAARARALAAKRLRDKPSPAVAAPGPEKAAGPGLFGLPSLW